MVALAALAAALVALAGAPLPSGWCCVASIASPTPWSQFQMPPLRDRPLTALVYVARDGGLALDERPMHFVELPSATVPLRVRVGAARCGDAASEVYRVAVARCRRALRAPGVSVFLRISGSDADHDVGVTANPTSAAELFEPAIDLTLPAGTRALDVYARGLPVAPHAPWRASSSTRALLARTNFDAFPRSAARPLRGGALRDGWWAPYRARLASTRRERRSAPRVVLHIGDLSTIDGYKMSIVAQARHLHRARAAVRFEYLDLGCLPAADARKSAVRRILTAPGVAIRVHELCVQAPIEPGLDVATFRAGLRALTNPHARALDDAAAGVPSFVAIALRPVAALLVERAVTTLVLTNGAERHDEWLLELARMYGVPQRVVDLGSKGPLAPFPVTPAVTHYVAPSHFVAQHVNVAAALAHLPDAELVVLHPFIDLERDAAVSAGADSALGARSVAGADADADGAARRCAAERAAAPDTLVVAFVGRLVPQKGGGIFVRAVSVLLCTVTFHANLAHSLTRSP
jgi:glycosyltransferase involved in cell wall biosynthesis